MVVDSGRMVFFFGAGASAEFGIPLMRKMTEDCKSLAEGCCQTAYCMRDFDIYLQATDSNRW
jgi:NAD-dependent SIR2 family protein deacetylase